MLGNDISIVNMMLHEANNVMLTEIEEGKLSFENERDKELLVNWLRANLASSDKILSILEAWAMLLYNDDMEREYIVQFINRVREVANSADNKW